MKNSILSVKFLCGSVFLICLYLDGNIAALINEQNTTKSSTDGVANGTSERIAGNISAGTANTSKEASNDTVRKVASSTFLNTFDNISGKSGTGGKPNETSLPADSLLASDVSAPSRRANGDPSPVATNSSDGSASNITVLFTSNTSRESISNTTNISESTGRDSLGAAGDKTTHPSTSSASNTLSSTIGNSSRSAGVNTTPVSSSHVQVSTVSSVIATSSSINSSRATGVSTTLVSPSHTSNVSAVSSVKATSNGRNSSKAGVNTTPVSFSNAPKNSKVNTVNSIRAPSKGRNSSKTGFNTTPVSSSTAPNNSVVNILSSSTRATSIVGGAVGSLSTAKPLINSSNKKPGNSSGVMAGTNSRSGKKRSDESTVWPFDVSTEEITTEIPAPPPLEETDPSKKIKEKKPSPPLGPSLSSDGKPCNQSYRQHETDRSKYMQLESDGIWQRRDCSPDGNLVWIQELCECGFDKAAENMIYEDACPSYKPDPKNKHGYLWQVHGVFVPMPCIESLVWSQKDCMCTWDESPKSDWAALANQKVVCQRILELKLDNDLTNSAARYEVKANSASGRGGISKIRFVHTIGATDNAAEIQNQPLTLDAFKGNDFQKAITFTLNFKILKSRAQSRTPMVLLTNGCVPDQTSLIRAPSINLSFTPGTNTFRVQFNTTEAALDETALAEPDQNGWFKTVLYLQDQTINLEVNGKKILSTNGMLGTIPKNLCPLLIGGSDIERNQNFYGYLDNVNIIKDCKFHDANIKVL